MCPIRSPDARAGDVARTLDHAGDLARLLAESERETRARLYRTLDLVLNLTLSETLRPWTFGCSDVVAGAGLDPGA